MTIGLPAKYYVDANGRYLGAFAGVVVLENKQTGTRTVVESQKRTILVERDVPVDKGDRIVIERRNVREPETVERPVEDADGKVLGSVRVPVIDSVETEQPVFATVEVEKHPEIPRGAIEVPAPPDAPDMLWRNGAWSIPRAGA